MAFASVTIATNVSNAFELPEGIDLDISTQDDIYQLRLDGRFQEEVADQLVELFNNPIELNSASKIELFSVPGLSWEDAERMVEARKRLGGFKRLSELIAEVGFDRRKLKQIEPFISVHRPSDQIEGRLQIDLLETENDKKPYALRAKLLNSLKDAVQIGGTLNKSMTPRAQLKLHKFYLLWQPKQYSRYGYIKRLILGNYSAGFGSGLTFNDARRLKPDGIYPDYTLSSYRQRGLSLQAEYKRLKPTLFASYSNFEQLVGMDIAVRLPFSSESGLSWYSSSTQSRAYGIHFDSQQKLMQLRAEVTRKIESKFALFGEISSHFDKGSLLVSFRRYGANFVNPHSYSYADSDDEPNNRDEFGVRFQLKYLLTPKLKLFGNYDQWKHPSSNLSENRGQMSLRYELSKFIEVVVSTKFHDEDISTGDMPQISQWSWVKWQPTSRFSLTSAYSQNKSDKSDKSDDSDDYVYFRFDWRVLRWLKFQGRLKLLKLNKLDTALFENSEAHPNEIYAQIQIWKLQGFSGRLKYSRIQFASNSSARPNPKRQLSIGIDYIW
jgi:hypothetical protein